eukprot:3353638-Prymnesium_polylepis.1
MSATARPVGVRVDLSVTGADRLYRARGSCAARCALSGALFARAGSEKDHGRRLPKMEVELEANKWAISGIFGSIFP